MLINENFNYIIENYIKTCINSLKPDKIEISKYIIVLYKDIINRNLVSIVCCNTIKQIENLIKSDNEFGDIDIKCFVQALKCLTNIVSNNTYDNSKEDKQETICFLVCSEIPEDDICLNIIRGNISLDEIIEKIKELKIAMNIICPLKLPNMNFIEKVSLNFHNHQFVNEDGYFCFFQSFPIELIKVKSNLSIDMKVSQNDFFLLSETKSTVNIENRSFIERDIKSESSMDQSVVKNGYPNTQNASNSFSKISTASHSLLNINFDKSANYENTLAITTSYISAQPARYVSINSIDNSQMCNSYKAYPTPTPSLPQSDTSNQFMTKSLPRIESNFISLNNNIRSLEKEASIVRLQTPSVPIKQEFNQDSYQPQPQQPLTSITHNVKGSENIRCQSIIWSGLMQWNEKVRNEQATFDTNNPALSVVTHSLMCQIYPMPGFEDLKTDSWPHNFVMQAIQQDIIHKLGNMFRNAKTVTLVFPNQENTNSYLTLNRLLTNNMAGCIMFPNTVIDLRVMILLYSLKKKSFIGLIPLDQVEFVNSIRKILSQKRQMHLQSQMKQQNQIMTITSSPITNQGITEYGNINQASVGIQDTFRPSPNTFHQNQSKYNSDYNPSLFYPNTEKNYNQIPTMNTHYNNPSMISNQFSNGQNNLNVNPIQSYKQITQNTNNLDPNLQQNMNKQTNLFNYPNPNSNPSNSKINNTYAENNQQQLRQLLMTPQPSNRDMLNSSRMISPTQAANINEHANPPTTYIKEDSGYKQLFDNIMDI
ncbi:unnamed protein product [Gordionus sp. m RMFG-2023]